MEEMERALAVLVLYKLAPAQSPALQALLAAQAGGLRGFNLLVYDNSPASQAALIQERPFLTYVHDPANGGLFAAYTHALQLAANVNCDWLMLFDQDTELTREYVAESLRLIEEPVAGTAAIVPRLLVDGRQCSPHRLGPAAGDRPIATGLSVEPLTAWNSGAILSVRRLVAVGGFPKEFALDNLDYATFRLLQQDGNRLFVMDSRLPHHLSVNDPRTLSLNRLRGKLAADLLFQQRFQQRTKMSLAAEFLRTGISLLCKVRNKRMGMICLRYSVAVIAGRRAAGN